MSILSVQDISKSYKLRKVVKGISLEINSGEVVGLLGPNGAGKTTAFYMIVGLISAESGTILLDGQDLTAQPMHQRSDLHEVGSRADDVDDSHGPACPVVASTAWRFADAAVAAIMGSGGFQVKSRIRGSRR